MGLLDLPDIHTGRHAQRIQHDIQRTSVRQVRHILHGQHAGNNTLVAVTAGHLVAHGDLSLLGNVDADGLIDPGSQLVAVLSGKYLRVDDDAVGAVRHLQGSVTDFAGLLTEDRAQQALLRGQLGLALRGDLADQDISRADFRADADDAALVQILQGVVADAGHVPGDLLRSQLGVAGLGLVLFNMNGGV